MTTKKTTTKKATKNATTTKATSGKQAPGKKAPAKGTTAKKAAAKKAPAKGDTTEKTTAKKKLAKGDTTEKTTAKKKLAKTAEKKMSALDAAAKVLGESKEPLNAKAMIEAMAAKNYWTSPGGKTPHATLYAAILREINTKGSEARFRKTDRGHFTLKSNG